MEKGLRDKFITKNKIYCDIVTSFQGWKNRKKNDNSQECQNISNALSHGTETLDIIFSIFNSNNGSLYPH